jgi:1-phosphofructokinase family hexose kinase
MIVFVAASPSIDRMHMVEALRPGGIHRPGQVVAVAGGKALNAARAAHALGADVRAVALLSGHAGRWVAAALAEEGVAYEAVRGPGETRTCVSVADGESLTEFYEPGPPLDSEHWAALEAAAARAASGAAWVGVSGSLPPGAPADACARLIRVARDAGARVALDAEGEALAAGLEAKPDFVKVNAGEAAGLGVAGAAALRAAAGGGARAAAITHGAEGMEFAAPDGALHHVAPPRRGAYPVGSGDAALGGFLAALDAGAGWEDALARAAAAAAANAQVPGAGRLGWPRPSGPGRRPGRTGAARGGRPPA